MDKGSTVFIDWRQGTRHGFDSIVPDGGNGAGASICKRDNGPVLSPWSRAFDPRQSRALLDTGAASAQARFRRLSNTDKLGIALQSAAAGLGREVGAKLQELINPTNLAIMAGALAIWVGSHATPVGWIVDIGMVGLGVVALGAEAIAVMRELQSFAMGVVNARSEPDLLKAGQHLSKAVAIVGVDVVVALLLKKALVKVRQPQMSGKESGGQKLFGKYDPASAERGLGGNGRSAPPDATPPPTTGQPQSVWHSTANSKAAQGVLNGIDPKYLNPNSRFGPAFYVAERPGTTVAELAHHGVEASHGIRFQVDPKALKPLDLTNPDVAAAWGYKGGNISSATQAIGTKAQEQGYNAIRFYSERAPGEVNIAVLDDFNDILKPVIVTPVRP